jgi:hypothetical protein
MTSIWLEFRLGFIPLDDLDDEEEEEEEEKAVLHEILWIDVAAGGEVERWGRGGWGRGGGCRGMDLEDR